MQAVPDTSDAGQPAGFKPKAIVLLSGGLDSTLAVKLMQNQGVDVLAVNFVSTFCTCSSRKEHSCSMASMVARELGVPLRVIGKGRDYLDVVEHPKFGYGRALNPCLDCRIYVLRKTAAIMREEGAQFVVTGEVLGQRPMSQYRAALKRIETESGLEGLILRPLSAQWLDPTLPEQKGWVDRSKLLAIQGRSRSEQLALAEKEGIEKFGCPSGGCLLTDPNIARRMRDLFRFCPDYSMADAKMATFGRHFRIHDRLKAILGRDESENERLQRMAPDLPRMELVDIPGPMMFLRGEMRDDDREPLARLLKRYAHKAGPGTVPVLWTHGDRTRTWTVTEPAADDDLKRWEI